MRLLGGTKGSAENAVQLSPNAMKSSCRLSRVERAAFITVPGLELNLSCEVLPLLSMVANLAHRALEICRGAEERVAR